MSVRYAELSELPRVNELRMMVSGLHAEGRPDIFRVGFCEELQHRVYQAFESSGADVIVACVENEPRAVLPWCSISTSRNRLICAHSTFTTLKSSVWTRGIAGAGLGQRCCAFAKRKQNIGVLIR